MCVHARMHARLMRFHPRARTRTCAVSSIAAERLGHGIALHCVLTWAFRPPGRDLHRRDGRQLARHSAAAGHPPYRSRECGAQSRILWPQHLGTAALGRLRFSARPHSAPRLPCRGDRRCGARCTVHAVCCVLHIPCCPFVVLCMAHVAFSIFRLQVRCFRLYFPRAHRMSSDTLHAWHLAAAAAPAGLAVWFRAFVHCALKTCGHRRGRASCSSVRMTMLRGVRGPPAGGGLHMRTWPWACARALTRHVQHGTWHVAFNDSTTIGPTCGVRARWRGSASSAASSWRDSLATSAHAGQGRSSLTFANGDRSGVVRVRGVPAYCS